VKRRIERILVVTLLFATAGCAPDYETTYVVPPVLNVRKGPSVKDPILTQVRRGQELRIVASEGKWLSVLLPDDAPGWVHGDYLGSPPDVRASLNRDLQKKQGTTVRRRTPRPVRKTSKTLSIDGLLTGLSEEVPTEILPPLEGVDRVIGATRKGQVVVEFWGDEDKLDRAMMMVSVLNLSEDDLNVNAQFALDFVKSALPGLKRDREWMVRRLKEISSRDEGSGELQAKGRVVSFEFLKALGAVRVTVEPTT
tara:strand:- start:2569 stop:3327 length:759 start_codon:yes stop_codon:yes gene_type:complete